MTQLACIHNQLTANIIIIAKGQAADWMSRIGFAVKDAAPSSSSELSIVAYISQEHS